MSAEIGSFALIVALLISIAQSIIPMIGAAWRDRNFMAFGTTAAISQLGFIILAFCCLTYAFYTSDFSLAVVAENSNSAMPTIYRLSAVWGNHEGSMLLWILILAIFGASVALFGTNLPATLKSRVIAVQGMIAAGFLALSVFTSNPFARLHPAPLDGKELNPLLQDIGLAIHPPFLYLGYVGFSVTFAFAIAALIEGKIDASWARFVRPWVLAAWCFLTIGITLGSFWAYYELGWGGWWFWDPVENASFMPWLVGTALLHSALVVERRQALVVWTMLLAILTFSLSLVGTFLVRSGVLTSVHSFASDPARGLGILILLFLATGGGLFLFALRAGDFNQSGQFKPMSREGGLVANNILLVTAAGTVFLGTFYPMFVEFYGSDKISVGPPYFNRTFLPLMIPLLIILAAGPILRWKRDSIIRVLKELRPIAVLCAVSVATIIIFGGANQLVPALAMGLAIWLVLGSLLVFAKQIRLLRTTTASSVNFARTTPRSTYGMILAHAGMGFAVAGITATTAWQSESISSMAPNDSQTVAGYEFVLDGVSRIQGPNFEAEQAIFTVSRSGNFISTMTSERRFYPVRGTVTTEAGIKSEYLSNLYIAIGEADDTGKWAVRIYHHPLALLIWMGPLLMAFGGFVSLSDRRFRAGVPQPKMARPKLADA